MLSKRIESRISTLYGLSSEVVEDVLQMVLYEVMVDLEERGKVKLRGLGILRVHKAPPTFRRDPASGITIERAGKSTLRFKAKRGIGARLKDSSERYERWLQTGDLSKLII